MLRHALPFVVVLACLSACGSPGGGDEDGSGDETIGTDAEGDDGVDPGPDPDADAGWEGTCPESLADRLRVTELSGLGNRNRTPAFLAATNDGGTWLAWVGTSEVQLVRLDAQEQVHGAVLSIEGVDVNGLVAHPDGVAMLIHRELDVMDLVRLEKDGSERFATTIIGNVDHETVGSKYVEPGRTHHQSRLGWHDGRYAAYVGHNQRWDDGIGHQGDLLWYYDENGELIEKAWDWGCSHSLGVRLHYHAGLGRIFTTCDTDGVYSGIGLNGSRTLIAGAAYSSDIVPLDDGALIAFSATSGGFSNDAGVVRVGADLTIEEPVMLPPTPDGAEVAVHLAPYGSQFVMGWTFGSAITPWDSFGPSQLAMIDESGQLVHDPEDIPVAFSAKEDFVVLANGDIAWVSYPTEQSSQWPLSIVRMRSCE